MITLVSNAAKKKKKRKEKLRRYWSLIYPSDYVADMTAKTVEPIKRCLT